MLGSRAVLYYFQRLQKQSCNRLEVKLAEKLIPIRIAGSFLFGVGIFI